MSGERLRGQGEFVVPCTDLDRSIEFFVSRAGFRLESIFPADRPRSALVRGHEISIRLELSGEIPGSYPLRVRIPGNQSKLLVSPDGIEVEFYTVSQGLELPEPKLEYVVCKSDGNWNEGRAGMKYRDLIPGRLGGFLIASQIHVSEPGPVPDYVHFHEVEFQIIYCLRGWAKLVYQDQGEPFIFEVGDCVLQPPGIRHRVLETSGDFDVIELSSPAEHITRVEHEFDLPTADVIREKRFGGQRFGVSRSSEAKWVLDKKSGFSQRPTKIGNWSGGKLEVSEIESDSPGNSKLFELPTDEISFVYVLRGLGAVELKGGESLSIEQGDTITIPPEAEFQIESETIKLLIVSVGLNSD